MRKKKIKKKGCAVFWNNQRTYFVNSFKYFDKPFFNMVLFDLLTFFSVFIISLLGFALIKVLSYRILPFLKEINEAATSEIAQEIILQAASSVSKIIYSIFIVFILTAIIALALFCVFNYMAWLSLKKQRAVKKWFWKYYLVNLLLIIIGLVIGFFLVSIIQTVLAGWLLLIEFILLIFFSFLVKAFFKDKIRECFKQAWSEFMMIKKYVLPIVMIILVWIVVLSVLSLLVNINNVIFSIINIIVFVLFIGWSRRYLFFVLKSKG